jgi:hypothetical protein
MKVKYSLGYVKKSASPEIIPQHSEGNTSPLLRQRFKKCEINKENQSNPQPRIDGVINFEQ